MTWIDPVDVKTLLQDFDTSQLTNLDGFINSQIAPCEAYLESLTGRKFSDSGSVTKTVDGTGTYTLFLPDRPLIEVSACKIYYKAQILKTFTNIGYENGTRPENMDLLVNRELGRLSSLDTEFPQGKGNILVTYRYGYSPCPEEVKLCGAMLVALQVLDKLSGKLTDDSQLVFIGAYGEAYAGTRYESLINHWTKFIERVINQYRKFALL